MPPQQVSLSGVIICPDQELEQRFEVNSFTVSFYSMIIDDARLAHRPIAGFSWDVPVDLSKKEVQARLSPPTVKGFFKLTRLRWTENADLSSHDLGCCTPTNFGCLEKLVHGSFSFACKFPEAPSPAARLRPCSRFVAARTSPPLTFTPMTSPRTAGDFW